MRTHLRAIEGDGQPYRLTIPEDGEVRRITNENMNDPRAIVEALKTAGYRGGRLLAAVGVADRYRNQWAQVRREARLPDRSTAIRIVPNPDPDEDLRAAVAGLRAEVSRLTEAVNRQGRGFRVTEGRPRRPGSNGGAA